MRRRWHRTVAAAVLLAVGLPVVTPIASPGASSPGQRQPNWPESSLSWLALGDSYSSGEGAPPTRGECHQSDLAYPLVAAQLLRDGGFPVDDPEHVACTGAQISAPRSSSTPSLEQQIEAVDGRYDLVTLTIGGNDARFSHIVETCVWPQTRSGALSPPTTPHVSYGCWQLMDEFDVWEQLRQRYDDVDTTHNLASIFYPWNWHLHDRLFSILREELIRSLGLMNIRSDLHVALEMLLEDVLAEDGHVVLLGYPRLFEPPDQWSWMTEPYLDDLPFDVPFDISTDDRLFPLYTSCWLVQEPFAVELRQAADELNSSLETVADRFPEVHYLDTAGVFESHNLCGRDETWLNGLSVGQQEDVPLLSRPTTHGSYHPNEAGHRALAGAVDALVRDLPWTDPPESPGDLGETPGPGDCAPSDRDPPPSLGRAQLDYGREDEAREVVELFLGRLAAEDYAAAADLVVGGSPGAVEGYTFNDIVGRSSSREAAADAQIGPAFRFSAEFADLQDDQYVVTVEAPVAPEILSEEDARPQDYGDALAFVVGPDTDATMRIRYLPRASDRMPEVFPTPSADVGTDSVLRPGDSVYFAFDSGHRPVYGPIYEPEEGEIYHRYEAFPDRIWINGEPGLIDPTVHTMPDPAYNTSYMVDTIRTEVPQQCAGREVVITFAYLDENDQVRAKAGWWWVE